MKTEHEFDRTAALLKILGSPFRLRLLYTLGEGESCVCHLETALDHRQAYISHHLMALRDAGLLATRREGKFVYYRVADTKIFELITSASSMMGIEVDGQTPAVEDQVLAACECPKCENAAGDVK